jgi:hypothetical protein
MLDRVTGMESGRLADRINTVVIALRPHADTSTVADVLDRAAPHLPTQRRP